MMNGKWGMAAYCIKVTLEDWVWLIADDDRQKQAKLWTSLGTILLVLDILGSIF